MYINVNNETTNITNPLVCKGSKYANFKLKTHIFVMGIVYIIFIIVLIYLLYRYFNLNYLIYNVNTSRVLFDSYNKFGVFLLYKDPDNLYDKSGNYIDDNDDDVDNNDNNDNNFNNSFKQLDISDIDKNNDIHKLISIRLNNNDDKDNLEIEYYDGDENNSINTYEITYDIYKNYIVGHASYIKNTLSISIYNNIIFSKTYDNDSDDNTNTLFELTIDPTDINSNNSNITSNNYSYFNVACSMTNKWKYNSYATNNKIYNVKQN